MCINSLCFLTETAFISFNIRTRFARHTIVKSKIKSQFDFKLVVKRKSNIYVEENTNRAFLLELLFSRIHLVATRSDPNRSFETCVQHGQWRNFVRTFFHTCKQIRRKVFLPDSEEKRN